ncbi:hypothetical protein F4820DRAFT_424027 [Hypoxylon rubiginosum]|uniref:Uncharacterized protein n=1 Tax=Hypoxylon rubiginosum TaxID=110542 RepID=A0ACB9YYK7_9PEZI|nr:hypothetical protein F4820DRAFT_424027 [Hypoxylon rubiginosum]
MSRSKAPLAFGLAAAGGIGYYLYSAGGDPKVAQKKAEADAHRASAKFKSEIPGRGEQAKKDAEKYGAEAGAKFDSALGKTQAELQKAAQETEAYAKDAKAAALKKVDEFDRKVEADAAKAKSGISSWFGGGK